MSNPASVTAANALSGEKTFQTVSFPITGDAQLDAISGCLAVINGMFDAQPRHYRRSADFDEQVSVAKYLLDRFTKHRDQAVKDESPIGNIGQGLGGAINPTYPGPNPYAVSSGSVGAAPQPGESLCDVFARESAAFGNLPRNAPPTCDDGK